MYTQPRPTFGSGQGYGYRVLGSEFKRPQFSHNKPEIIAGSLSLKEARQIQKQAEQIQLEKQRNIHREYINDPYQSYVTSPSFFNPFKSTKTSHHNPLICNDPNGIRQFETPTVGLLIPTEQQSKVEDARRCLHRKSVLDMNHLKKEREQIDKNNDLISADEVYKIQNQVKANNMIAINHLTKLVSKQIKKQASISTIIKDIEFTVPDKLESVPNFDIGFVIYGLMRRLRRGKYIVSRLHKESSTLKISWV